MLVEEQVLEGRNDLLVGMGSIVDDDVKRSVGCQHCVERPLGAQCAQIRLSDLDPTLVEAAPPQRRQMPSQRRQVEIDSSDGPSGSGEACREVALPSRQRVPRADAQLEQPHRLLGRGSTDRRSPGQKSSVQGEGITMPFAETTKVSTSTHVANLCPIVSPLRSRSHQKAMLCRCMTHLAYIRRNSPRRPLETVWLGGEPLHVPLDLRHRNARNACGDPLAYAVHLRSFNQRSSSRNPKSLQFCSHARRHLSCGRRSPHASRSDDKKQLWAIC
mmetsp:Transcript_40669/g.128840  ORF Transcript_40669/g.128840 Transcript_40669/m.128840 type:complete len:273 (+) Transcript_40669:332-1150(+)